LALQHLAKEVDKEIARAVIDDDSKLNEIFEEIDATSRSRSVHTRRTRTSRSRSRTRADIKKATI
jgi:hypothetical protein